MATLKIIGKIIVHLILGFLMTLVVTGIGMFFSAFTSPAGLSEMAYYVRGLQASLFVWFFLAVTVMLVYVQQIKIDPASLAIRQVLLWGPIAIGWYFTVQGYDGILILGMIASSAVLSYEVRVWRSRKSKG